MCLAAIDAVRADVLLARALSQRPLDFHRKRSVVAAGKAASAMVSALMSAGVTWSRAMLSSTHVHDELTDEAEGVDLFLAGHPAPTVISEAAAHHALQLAGAIGGDDELLVLLSGGASALLAGPADGLALGDKIAATRVLLEGGAAIHELNTVRKHLSAVKGGQLAAAARGRVITFALSDVTNNDPSVIGSGPTVADPSTYQDAVAVAHALQVWPRLPDAVRRVLEDGAAGRREETPKPGDPRVERAEYLLIGSRQDAMAGARARAEAMGYAVHTIADPIVGEAREAGVRLVERAIAEAPSRRPACVIASGETTVHVLGRGRGGRNQELSLAAAPRLAALGSGVVLASIGTDGIDGPTDAAGAMVDAATATRARLAGLDPTASLADNDAYTLLDATSDLIRTGPTDTNVGDVQIMLFA